jgi:hypothetical protein
MDFELTASKRYAPITAVWSPKILTITEEQHKNEIIQRQHYRERALKQ